MPRGRPAVIESSSDSDAPKASTSRSTARTDPKESQKRTAANEATTTKRAKRSTHTKEEPATKAKSTKNSVKANLVKTPESGSEEDQTENEGEDFTWRYPDLLTEEPTSGENYTLEYLVRAHSRSTHEGQDETETNTWACALQPTLPVLHRRNGASSLQQMSNGDADSRSREGLSTKSSSIVATCGGNTVCLIDCSLGKVMAKYSHMAEEEFKCLAWTTLDHHIGDEQDAKAMDEGIDQDERHKQSNILAAAGHLGSIKLINPLQNTCYRYLTGHTDSIVRLKFSLTNPRWLFSASADGSVRLWDIGSLSGYETEACCLAKFAGLDDSVTAIGVCEKYLVAGTESGLMAHYDLDEVTREIEDNQADVKKASGVILTIHPTKIYPPSQEWHESAVDDIVYIPYFSSKSYRVRVDRGENVDSAPSRKQKASTGSGRGRGRGGGRGRGRGGGRGRGRGKAKTEDSRQEAEFIFASRESYQGEIIVWDATHSTATDAELKTILEWPIAEDWTKFTVAENYVPGTNRRQNVLMAGSTDGKIVLFDLGKVPTRARDGNIVAEGPTKILSHPESKDLLRDVAITEDLAIIVAGDWHNRVLIWNLHDQDHP